MAELWTTPVDSLPRARAGTADPVDNLDNPVNLRADGDILDLDGVPAPNPPRGGGWTVMSVRVRPDLAAFVRERAYADRATSINAWLVGRLEALRDGDDLPADCREWLRIQAAQCGCPGDPDRALVLVLRHLARRWPNGARLNP